MRWDELFRDLEGQLEAVEGADLGGEVSDRTRREVAQLRLVDRLRPAIGHPVCVHVHGGDPVAGRLCGVGAQWLLVDEAAGRQALVPLTAVLGVTGLGALSAVPGAEGRVAARLGLGHALRGIARDRLPVSVRLADGSQVAGTVDRVGEDFLELAEHPPGEPRRRGAVSGMRTIPLAALAVLRSRD